MRKNLFFLFLLSAFSIKAQQFQAYQLTGSKQPSGVHLTHFDYDSDGDEDLIFSSIASSGRLTVFINDNGSFDNNNKTIINFSEYSYEMAYPTFGDIDKDGDMDMIISLVNRKSDDRRRFETKFSFYRNNDGKFTKENHSMMSSLNRAFNNLNMFHLEDWDGDGDLDGLITANGNVWYSEFKDDVFQFPAFAGHPLENVDVETPKTTTVAQLIFVNPDKDNDKDILLLDATSNGLRYYRNDNGSLSLQTNENNPYRSLIASDRTVGDFLAIVDFDKDGFDDAYSLFTLHGEELYSRHLATAFHFYKGTANGFIAFDGAKNPFAHSLKADQSTFRSSFPAMAIADLDNSGKPELYFLEHTGSTKKISKINEQGLYDDTTNPFASLSIFTAFTNSFELFDWDKDGDMDLFTDYTLPDRKRGLMYLRNDNGVFTQVSDEENPVSAISVSNGPEITLGDFNGDGFTDLVLGYRESGSPETPQVLFYANDKNGKLIATTAEQNPFKQPYEDNVYPEAGDINNDGLIDLLIGEQGKFGLRTTSAYLNKGDNTFQYVKHSESNLFGNKNISQVSELYDIDKDGDLDLFTYGHLGSVLMSENHSHHYQVKKDGDFIFSEDILQTTKVHTSESEILEFHVQSSEENFDVTDVRISDEQTVYVGYATYNALEDFKVLDINKSNPKDIIIRVEYKPTKIYKFANDGLVELIIETNDPSRPTYIKAIKANSKGGKIDLRQPVSPSSGIVIPNNGYLQEFWEVTGVKEYELTIYNFGNADLNFPENAFELPDGITLSESTPLPEKLESWGSTNVKFNVEVGKEEPNFKKAILHSDGVNSPYHFGFYFASVPEESSPARLSTNNIRTAVTDNSTELKVHTNSGHNVNVEIIEGEDLLTFNKSSRVSTGSATPSRHDIRFFLKGKKGVAKIKISVPDNPATETYANSIYAYINIVDDPSSKMTTEPVLAFDNIEINTETAPFFLYGATSNQHATPSAKYEIISGEDIISLDGPNNSVLAQKGKVGTAKIKATFPETSISKAGSIIATVTVTEIKEDQTISFDLSKIGRKTYSSGDFDITATASSSLPVSFRVVNGPVLLDGNKIKINGVGTATIEASQAGNASYNAAEPVVQSFDIEKSRNMILFNPALDNVKVGDEITLNATSDSGEEITFTATGAVTINGNTAKITGAGQASLTAHDQGNEYFSAARSVIRSFVVGQEKEDQTISFDLSKIGRKTYSSGDFNITATASSSLPVSFRVINGPVLLDGNKVKINGVGTATIEASQAGNASFNAAEPVVQSFEIEKSGNMILFSPALDNLKVGDEITLNATSDSGEEITFTATGAVTINGNTAKITGAGQASLTAHDEGNEYFSAARSVTRSFVIGQEKANQTISFDLSKIGTKHYSSHDFDISATTSSGLPVSFKVVSGPVTLDGNTVKITGAGTVTIEASQEGNTNYFPAEPVVQSFMIEKSRNMILFNPTLDNLKIGDKITLSATSDSGEEITFTATGAVSINGNTATITGAGQASITAHDQGNENFLAARSVIRTFEISQEKENQSIVFDLSNLKKTYGDAPFSLTGTTTSGLAVEYTVVEGPISINGDVVTINGAGTATIKASQSGNEQYNAASPVEASFEIKKSEQVITIEPIGTKNAEQQTFHVFANSNSKLELNYQVDGPASIVGSELTLDGTEGTVTVSVSQTGNENYLAASASISFEVKKNLTEVTFAISSANFVYNGNKQLPEITTSPAGISYQIAFPDGEPVGAGEYLIVVEADQEGYTGSSSAMVIITKAEQTVSIEPIGTKSTDSQPFNVVANANSGLDLRFSVTGPATISGNTISLDGTEGTVTVTAYQAGNKNYLPAEASVSFEVKKNITEVTIDIDETEFVYNGGKQTPSFSTKPEGINVKVSYPDGEPVDAGEYRVITTVDQDGYTGSVTTTIVVKKAELLITLSDLQQIFDGSSKEVAYSIDPDVEVDAVEVTYNGESALPSEQGEYEVIVTIDDKNYQGSVNGVLVISSTTNVKELSRQTIRVYPSPSKGNFTLDMSENHQATLEVFSFSGIKVYSQNISGNKQNIQLPSGLEGMHIIKVSENGKVLFVQQHLIQR